MSDEIAIAETPEVIVPRPDIAHGDLGHVEKWRRRGDVWEGLVAREVEGETVTAWVPALHMAPSEPA